MALSCGTMVMVKDKGVWVFEIVSTASYYLRFWSRSDARFIGGTHGFNYDSGAGFTGKESSI
jgi:hypothetical protein